MGCGPIQSMVIKLIKYMKRLSVLHFVDVYVCALFQIH